MKKVICVYYDTIDGVRFIESGDSEHVGNDPKAHFKAVNHEIDVMSKSIGEYDYYVVELFHNKHEFKGYIPKIDKNTGYTTRIKFAKRYKTVKEAYIDAQLGQNFDVRDSNRPVIKGVNEKS